MKQLITELLAELDENETFLVSYNTLENVLLFQVIIFIFHSPEFNGLFLI